jgi:hypothetical protein
MQQQSKRGQRLHDQRRITARAVTYRKVLDQTQSWHHGQSVRLARAQHDRLRTQAKIQLPRPAVHRPYTRQIPQSPMLWSLSERQRLNSPLSRLAAEPGMPSVGRSRLSRPLTRARYVFEIHSGCVRNELRLYHRLLDPNLRSGNQWFSRWRMNAAWDLPTSAWPTMINVD